MYLLVSKNRSKQSGPLGRTTQDPGHCHIDMSAWHQREVNFRYLAGISERTVKVWYSPVSRHRRHSRNVWAYRFGGKASERLSDHRRNQEGRFRVFRVPLCGTIAQRHAPAAARYFIFCMFVASRRPCCLPT